MEIKEFSELDRIQEDQISANAYKLGNIDASMQQAADIAGNSTRQSVIDYITSNQSAQIDLAGWSAFNSIYPELNVKTEHNDESNSGYLPRDKRGGGRALGHDAARGYAQDQTTYSFEQRRREGVADQSTFASRLNFHVDRMKYFAREPDFKKDRRLTAQSLIQEKIQSVISPGGALNYGERMGFIEQRSLLDFTNAYSRLVAISDGLKFIFNIDAGSLPNLNRDSAKSKPIENTVRWLRNAADRLAKFLLLDQIYTYRFSLEISYKYTISQPRFRCQCHTSLCSAYFIYGTSDPWAAPEEGADRGDEERDARKDNYRLTQAGFNLTFLVLQTCKPARSIALTGAVKF